ncbi:3-dehydroquinate dehydratase [Bacteroidia bacterium]|nr:3-dehydroquinate dehydratase [Bacteroidia bacterium]
MLGKREPTVYGDRSFDEYFPVLQNAFQNVELSYFQTNSEGAIIDKIQEADGNFDGIVLNAGAYTHTSIAIADAVRAVQTPEIEVHISNIFAREPYRQHSFLSEAARGVICGFGMESYRLAVAFFAETIK